MSMTDMETNKNGFAQAPYGDDSTYDLRTRTLLHWAQDVLSGTDLPLRDVSDLSTDVHISCLVETITGRSVGKHMYRRRAASQISAEENVAYVLYFLEQDGVELRIDSETVVEGDAERIAAGLLWPLVAAYCLPDRTPPDNGAQAMLRWLRQRLQGHIITNLTSDWKDGRHLGALINSYNSELCADWQSWEQDGRRLREAIVVASSRLAIRPYLTCADIASPELDDVSMTVYLQQFINKAST